MVVTLLNEVGVRDVSSGLEEKDKGMKRECGWPRIWG